MISRTVKKFDSNSLNCSDDELMLYELKNRCSVLKSEIESKILLKENLFVLVKENENIGQRLLQAKKDYESQESELLKTLFFIQVSAEKQKILSRKKLNEFNIKHHEIKEKLKKLPMQAKLKDLKNFNEILEQDVNKFTENFENTKNQYAKMWENLLNSFRKAVCEFSDAVLKMKKNGL